MTPMNLAQSIAVLTLLALPLVTSAQKRDKTEGDDKSNRTTQLIRESWQHVAFHAITELQDQEIPQTLENQTFGFGLTYMKHDRSGLFDGGLDLGVQPLERGPCPKPFGAKSRRILCRQTSPFEATW